ncbi:MAG TPA: hypothetical protein VI488_09755 [Candidatus Angelobacter sp.]
MMRWLPIVLLILTSGPLPGASSSSRWKINLEQSHGLQSFDREISAFWMIQQGVLFLTPDRVLAYQVNRTQEQVRLAPRDASGGAGNFVLNIKVLSVQDGHLIKSLNLPTNGAVSSVIATRGGGFLARTGSALYLYSADFAPVASRELPLKKSGRVESWQVRVSPSGAEVVLLHEEVLGEAEVLSDNTVLHDGEAKVEVEILNSETLKPEKTFTLSHTLPFWAPADKVLLSSNPAHSYSDGQLGTLDFNGHWSPIRAEFDLAKSSCPYSLSAIDGQRVVLYGCEAFTVLSTSGKRLFSRSDGRYVFRSVAASGSYLAAACDHYRVGSDIPHSGWDLSTRADHIEVYDLDRRSRLFSVPVHRERVYYALSPQGDLAVVDGPSLEMVQAGH